MYAQAQQHRPGFYSLGTKEADLLDKANGRKAGIIQKAYEAAVAELGYSDKEMMSPQKAKEVARLMFSDRYLGNTEFNPEIGEEFAEMSDVDKQRVLEHKLGMNLHTFVGNGGVIDRYGGLRRGSVTDAVERNLTAQATQQLKALAWQSVYDPKKSLSENMQAYADALQEDPILAHTGAKIDPGKFDSVDDIADALTTSLTGESTRKGFHYRNGVEFN